MLLNNNIIIKHMILLNKIIIYKILINIVVKLTLISLHLN